MNLTNCRLLRKYPRHGPEGRVLPKAHTGFDIPVSPDVAETPVPGREVMELIDQIDPDGVRRSEFR